MSPSTTGTVLQHITQDEKTTERCQGYPPYKQQCGNNMYSGTAIAVLVYLRYITLQQNTTQRQQWQCWSIHNTSHCSRTSCRNSNGSFSLSMIHSTAAEHHTEKQWQYWSIHTPYFSRTLHRQQWQYWSIHNTLYCRRTSHRDSSIGLSTIHCTAGEHHTETAVLVYPQYTTAAEHHTETAVLVYPQYTVLQENITQRQQYWSIHNTLYCRRTSHRDSSIGLSTIHCTAGEHHTETAVLVYPQYTAAEHHTETGVLVYPQYTAAEHHTETGMAVYHYQSIHNTLYLFTRPIATEHHTKKRQRQDQSIHTQHQTAEEYHAEMTAAESVYTTYITLQKNITQKYNNSSTSVHNTYCSRSSSHKETATAVLLSVYPHDITLQKNITQRDSNGCITIRLLYQSIHRTLSAKYNAYSYKLFQKF